MIFCVRQLVAIEHHTGYLSVLLFVQKQGMWAQTTPHHSTGYISLLEQNGYWYSVTCIIKPIKCLLNAQNCIAIV